MHLDSANQMHTRLINQKKISPKTVWDAHGTVQITKAPTDVQRVVRLGWEHVAMRGTAGMTSLSQVSVGSDFSLRMFDYQALQQKEHKQQLVLDWLIRPGSNDGGLRQWSFQRNLCPAGCWVRKYYQVKLMAGLWWCISSKQVLIAWWWARDLTTVSPWSRQGCWDDLQDCVQWLRGGKINTYLSPCTLPSPLDNCGYWLDP